jgi:hypothetical protein
VETEKNLVSPGRQGLLNFHGHTLSKCKYLI